MGYLSGSVLAAWCTFLDYSMVEIDKEMRKNMRPSEGVWKKMNEKLVEKNMRCKSKEKWFWWKEKRKTYEGVWIDSGKKKRRNEKIEKIF